MKAITISKPGPPEVLSLQERPVPVPRRNEVLIKIMAAGVNRPDIAQRKGSYPPPAGAPPDIPGLEVAGVIEAVGDGASRWQKGNKVCALLAGGGYAQFTTVDEGQCLPIPKGLRFEEAASLPETVFTVWHNVFQRGSLKKGEHFLVHGGSSGIGITAIQLAKAFGALQVFAIDINKDKLALAAEYGAISLNGQETNVVDEIKRLTHGKGVDVAIEMIGLPATQKQALRSVGTLGRVVLVGLSNKLLEVDSYNELLGNEVELIGSNDHRLNELPLLINFAQSKMLDISQIVTRTIPLDADAINKALDQLQNFGGDVRTVIVP